MGHDISRYLGDTDPDDPLEQLDGWSVRSEAAYLRTLYEVLEAQEYDGNVSGVWAARWFDRDQLQTALARLRQRLAERQEVQSEIDFVQACLAALPPGRSSVFIAFG